MEDAEKETQEEASVPSNLAEYKISKKEFEGLYVEVLYTIVHKLGANSPVNAEDLYDYAKKAFCMTQENHDRLYAIAKEEKPPILILNVTVVEAQNLEAKDPNGYSDPYCMLGIQPGSAQQSSGGEAGTGRRPSIQQDERRGLKRLGPSLRRKNRANSLTDTLPAKFIRTTTVKSQTLNPKWDEQFRLVIDDIHSDRLHLDIWDHDDESSVFDAARKLNEVAGFKGLGRYFKQIAQSARASIGDNVDDFLGCIDVTLDDIPSSGSDQWYELHGRSQRSSVQGQIRLRLSLGTREDRGGDGTPQVDVDNWKDVVEHQELVWIFIEHELSLHQGSSQDWSGELPQAALTILHQHAIQGDLTPLQQAMCRWIMFSRKHMETPLDYGLLAQLLEEFNAEWGTNGNPLTKDEEALVAESFNQFLDYCIELIQKHRTLFRRPGNDGPGNARFSLMLKCLSLIYLTPAFKYCCPFRHDLYLELVTSLKKGTTAWFQSIQSKRLSDLKGGDTVLLEAWINLINDINIELQRGMEAYQDLFDCLGVNYSVVVYKQIEKLLGEMDLGGVVAQFSPKLAEAANRATSTALGVTLFELYLGIQEFVKFRDQLPPEERKTSPIAGYYKWFAYAVGQWFDVAKVKAEQRIQKAVELDKLEVFNTYVKYSSSALDTTTCFQQIKEFWKQLDWPDKSGSYKFAMKLIETLCDGTVYYSNLMVQKLSQMQNNDGQESMEVRPEVLVAINNMEHILQSLAPLQEELDFESIIHAMEESSAAQCFDAADGLLRNAEMEVAASVLNLVAADIVALMRPELKKVLFHLAWAPEKLDAESAIGPLLDFLDGQLRELYTQLMQENFDRVLEVLWQLVLEELLETARTSLGKEKPSFFERLSASMGLLLEFFHANGKGLPFQAIQNELYQDLDAFLKLQKSATMHLIELYYLHRIEEQQRLRKTDYGLLTVKTSYTPKTGCLYVEVMNARNLLPLDPTGYSDPFVIVELVPKHFFPDNPPQKTKIQKKTLFPLFDESFEFNVPEDLCRREGAAICFTVMDFDVMTRNDFEGEAYLALCNVPGLSDDPIRPIDLPLTHLEERNEILLTLEARTWDKEAQEFVKLQRRKR